MDYAPKFVVNYFDTESKQTNKEIPFDSLRHDSKTSFIFILQDEIRQCMSEIEVSINLSMSGMSFQPTNTSLNNNNVPVIPSKMPKAPQQQKTDGYPPASTTPTDIMEISDFHICV